MAAYRRQTAYLIPTVMGDGSAQVCAQPGTATAGSHTAGGVAPYFILQKGFIGWQHHAGSANGSALSLALLDGSAVAAGTIAVIVCQPNSMTPFDFTVGADRYDGVAVKSLGGLWIHPTTELANHGTVSGTVSMTVKIKDVLQ